MLLPDGSIQALRLNAPSEVPVKFRSLKVERCVDRVPEFGLLLVKETADL